MSEVTPLKVEHKLLKLSNELDASHEELVLAEQNYHNIKADCEIALAKARLSYREAKRVQEIEDYALVACENLVRKLAIAEAVAKASRANANRLRIQVDIVRSIGTSVRASMEIA